MIRTASALCALLVATAAWALDPPQPAAGPEAEQPAAEPADASPATPPEEAADAGEESAAGDAEEESLPPLPPEQRRTGPTPQRFDPSEEVRADFPVSFPVDI